MIRAYKARVGPLVTRSIMPIRSVRIGLQTGRLGWERSGNPLGPQYVVRPSKTPQFRGVVLTQQLQPCLHRSQASRATEGGAGGAPELTSMRQAGFEPTTFGSGGRVDRWQSAAASAFSGAQSRPTPARNARVATEIAAVLWSGEWTRATNRLIRSHVHGDSKRHAATRAVIPRRTRPTVYRNRRATSRAARAHPLSHPLDLYDRTARRRIMAARSAT